MNTLVRPKDLEESFNQTKASELTGITYDMLLDATTFPEILPQLLPILKEYTIAAFNSSYDAKMIIRSAFAWGFTIPQFETLDVMTLFETFIGFSDWSTLSEVLEIFGIEEDEEAHRSLADVNSTIKILQEMQKQVKEEKIGVTK